MSQTAPAPKSAPKAEIRTGEPLLRVTDLKKHFPIRGGGLLERTSGAVRAVDGHLAGVRAGETVGLVGESGCGKSTAGRTSCGCSTPPPARSSSTARTSPSADRGRMRELRREMQMIFQDPYGSLNPRHTVGTIISAPFDIQNIEARRAAPRRRPRS